MKTITQVSLSIVLGLTLALSTAFAAKTNAVKAELKKPPSFLFVLQAKKGKLTPIKGKRNHFTLTLKHTDVNNVIAFSDRPYRMVKYISAMDIKKGWKKGSNSFEADPPNAVLTAKGHNAQIVVLHGMTVKDNTVSFHVNLTNTQYLVGKIKDGGLEEITVTIDDCIIGRSDGACIDSNPRYHRPHHHGQNPFKHH